MDCSQHYKMLKDMEKDPKNLAKYQKMYKYAYLLSDGVFKIVFTEEKSHSLLISLLNAMLDLHGGDAIGEISLEMQEFPVFSIRKTVLSISLARPMQAKRFLLKFSSKRTSFSRIA